MEYTLLDFNVPIRWVISIVFISFLNFSLVSQKISGTIKDTNKVPLIGATIYFDGSTFGTTSDLNGNFSIDKKGLSHPTLVVSFIGYETVYITDFSVLPLQITLIEKTTLLKEVVVTPDYFSRELMLEVFKNEFLGDYGFGKNCVIENENEIFLKFNVKNKTLEAFADNPIIIINKDLGYKLSFSLIKFEAVYDQLSLEKLDQKKVLFLGTTFFEDFATNDRHIKNRKKAFEGSLLHFFRTLAANDWRNQKFKVFDKGLRSDPMNHFETTKSESFISVDLKGGKSVRIKDQNTYEKKMNVLYNGKRTEITFKEPSFLIDFFGGFEPIEAISISGEMTKFRIGYMLPTNYNSDKTQN